MSSHIYAHQFVAEFSVVILSPGHLYGVLKGSYMAGVASCLLAPCDAEHHAKRHALVSQQFSVEDRGIKQALTGKTA